MNRKNSNAGTALPALATVSGQMAQAAESSCIFVLVHGAWHGGWCWSRVATRLRAAGHIVHTPTLTGLGERRHLISAQVNLDTHVEDVVNLLEFEDLRDVVLVGHSYGGIVITGVADRMVLVADNLMQIDQLIAGVLVLSAMGFAISQFIGVAERRLLRCR